MTLMMEMRAIWTAMDSPVRAAVDSEYLLMTPDGGER
jgi:hypothetical protein